MTRRDFIAIALLLAGIAFVAVQRFDAPSERRPDPRTYEDPGRTPGGFARRRPAPPPGAAGQPPPSLVDPGFTIEAEVKTGDVTGTAFSIGPGRWMSAKHVTESCRQVWIQTGPRRGVRAERVVEHPGADLSIIFTDGGAPELPVSTAVLNLGQVGFYFGFPKGEAGAVSADLIGRARMRTEGSRHSVEPVVGWAERRRIPHSEGSLGGLSGGPVLNGAGEVVGVAVASSIRRGRVFSAAPGSIGEMFERAGVAEPIGVPLPADPRTLTAREFPRHGEDLRDLLTVAKVVCLAGGKTKRRRRQRL